MSTKTTFKRVALVTVAALGFGLLSTVPSGAATQADSLALSAATATQLTGETKTAGSAVATVSFLSGGTTESLSVTAYLTSAPAGNTALPVFAVSDTSSAQVQSTPPTNLAYGAEITSQVAFIVPTVGTAAASAKLIVYMNAPSKTGTYVISLVPAVTTGGGIKNASTQTLTITVGTNPTLDTVITSATSILNVGETISATSDTTVTGSKTTMVGAADSATAAAVATIVVTPKNANGTTLPGSGNAGESLTATITGSGTLGSAAWGGGVAENGALPSGRAITVKLGNNIAVFGDGTSGVGTITITSALGVVLATETVTFYGAIASLTATVAKAAISKVGATAEVIKVIAKDSAGTVVSSGNVYATSASTSIINPAYASSAISATLGYALVTLTGIAAGTAAITIGTGSSAAATTNVTAPAVTIRVASGTVADVKVAFDKSSYVPGEKATITVTPVDASGLTLYDETYTVFATGGMSPSSAFYSGNATTSTSAQDGGVAGTGTASGIATYTVYMPIAEGNVTLSWTTAAGLATANASIARTAVVTVKSSSGTAATAAANEATSAANEATDAANAATDAANAAAEAADAATAAAQDAADAVAALSTQVAELISALKAQITSLTNLVIKIQKKIKA